MKSGLVPKPSPGPENSGSPQLCVDLVLRRFGGNKALLEKAARMFPTEAATILSTISQARSQGSAPNLESAVHTLKGIC